MKKYPKLVTLALVLFSTGCLMTCSMEFDPRKQEYTLVQTDEAVDLKESGVRLNGHVLKRGTDPVLDHGFIRTLDPASYDTTWFSLGTNLKSSFSIVANSGFLASEKYLLMTYVVTANTNVFGNAVNFTSHTTSPSPPTAISSVTPNSGFDGKEVVIQGSNFDLVSSPSAVTIGGQSTTLLSYSQTMLKVSVPPNLPLGPAEVAVYATTFFNNFTIVNPAITSFSPSQGTSSTAVTLMGNFSDYAPYNTIYFNNVQVTVDSSSGTQLIVHPPAGMTGNFNITINVNGKTFTTANTFTEQ